MCACLVMRGNWPCPLKLRVRCSPSVEIIWKIIISVGITSAIIGVVLLGNRSHDPEEYLEYFEAVKGVGKHGKKSFDVPGWALGTSLSASDYVDYIRTQSLVLPTNRAQDISYFHAGTFERNENGQKYYFLRKKNLLNPLKF